MTENQIKENIDNPAQLELLFRNDKKGFQKAFYSVYEEISAHQAAKFWKSRLEQEFSTTINRTTSLSEILLLFFVLFN